MKRFTIRNSLFTVFALFAVGCLLLSVLYGCGGSGSLTPASVDTAKKPPKPPPEEPTPPDPAIAFTISTPKGHELWVMNEDGTNRTKLVGGAEVSSPSWSPDGERLVFRNYDGNALNGKGLYVVSPDGSPPELLLPDPYAESPAWSPLGNCIAYSRYDRAASWGEPGYWGEIRAIDPEGGPSQQPQTLYQFSEPWGELGGISWSPDATRLTVAVLDESPDPPVMTSFLAVLDVPTGALTDVTRPAGFDWVAGGLDVDWARTSDRIAFNGRKVGEDSALWIGDVAEDSSGRASLQNLYKLVDEHRWALSPSWSPRDRQLVFVKSLRSPPRGALWTVEVANGQQSLLTAQKNSNLDAPDWRRRF